MRSILILFITFLLVACSDEKLPQEKAQPDLIIYSGITMVRPLNELTQEFAKQHNIEIEIRQGASGHALNSILKNKTGDIYFPGSPRYRKLPESAEIMLDRVTVGYNRMAFLVAKGNPKNITPNLDLLANSEYSVVIASPESGAVGSELKSILDKANITQKVFNNATYFTTDSHRISQAIKKGHADIGVNWYAAAIWPENIGAMDAILLPQSIVQRDALEMNLISYSNNKALAREFMSFAASAHGLKTFARYGFLTSDELKQKLNKVSPGE